MFKSLTQPTLVAAILCACAPVVGPHGGPVAPGSYPQLQPIGGLLAQADAASADPGPSVEGRAARLRARAALMRAPILDPATRARLAAAIRDGRA